MDAPVLPSQMPPHYSLEMDSLDGRPVLAECQGAVVELPEIGGRHYHYERQAA